VKHKEDALIILGMIGKHQKSMIADNLDILTRVGLGELSKVGTV
jgi:hypothetical protein